MTTIEQQQILDLQTQLDSLTKQPYDWNNAPVIVQINNTKWLLGPEAPEEMNWNDAREWCQSIGGELPPRDVLLQCYINESTKPLFKTAWYWSSPDFDATTAWIQTFPSGYQGTSFKTTSNYVRAVQAIKLGD